MLDFSFDEWHTYETVVKIAGVKQYIWFIVDSILLSVSRPKSSRESFDAARSVPPIPTG